MPRLMRGLAGASILAGIVGLTSCGASVPDAPDAVGDDYPGGGIPSSVAWPSDWLESIPGESYGFGWPIVGLRLEYVDDQWVWRVRSAEAEKDLFGDVVSDSDHGLESLIDAATLDVIVQHDVELTEAELAADGVGVYWAAQLSGETYPSPRIVELERDIEGGVSVWRITTYDTETGVQSVKTVDSR